MDAGARGIAVGVHTTQFAIRAPAVGLLRPVLELGAAAAREWLPRRLHGSGGFCLVAGAVGPTRQAVAEASLAHGLGYHAVLLSLGGLAGLDDDALMAHCREVGAVLPIVGFYLQPAVGGRSLSYDFWRALAELPSLAAIKVAPFDRYRTLDALRAVADSGREDIALYTGNDDAILADLLTVHEFGTRRVSFHGGLLGQFAVWTRRAVEFVDAARQARHAPLEPSWLALGAALTDANGALFDAAHAYAGCIPGIHEALRRQGLLENIRTLDPQERLSEGQHAEIDRIHMAYPRLRDDDFVAGLRATWLTP